MVSHVLNHLEEMINGMRKKKKGFTMAYHKITFFLLNFVVEYE